MTYLIPPPAANTHALVALRAQVRAFVQQQVAEGAFTPDVDSWLTGWDPSFSRALASRGWLGMIIPPEYGGHGKSFLERFVVTEELLAAGAPVAAHWIADRQAAPSLLRYGTEQQKRRYLPGIARGELFWAIGMSEPDSGSDLASIRARAEREPGGWRLTGTKVWTSGAHNAHAFFALARTTPADPASRHAGLSQFIVDLDSPGVEIRPILSMTGGHHFNEVHMESVFVPDELVLGTVGEGWRQVTSELSYERSGPERFLSTFQLLAALTAAGCSDVGRYVARTTGLHEMSFAVAGALERHEDVSAAAAVVKVLGTAMEGDIADLADLSNDDFGAPNLRELTARSVAQRPGFTLRGGTNEVLRGVIARELGLR
ncbi:acyl-CoA dehydrogenase family protein [Nocardia vaccinii]|uniref:acyl-CoA dehydrogenase family protein n=1 Tax=Nocardia vaccinii TaxID=1822 RepID=UPI000831D9AB|nr:acyl-CoA dehydrogenase family protein [Nocardia vaccinii]